MTGTVTMVKIVREDHTIQTVPATETKEEITETKEAATEIREEITEVKEVTTEIREVVTEIKEVTTEIKEVVTEDQTTGVVIIVRVLITTALNDRMIINRIINRTG
jgi:methyl-accepting chemotaxis protein